MEMKALGGSGIEVSSVGLGCMNFGMMCDQAATDSIVDAAIDSGVNFFDVADIYGGPHGKAEEDIAICMHLKDAQEVLNKPGRGLPPAQRG